MSWLREHINQLVVGLLVTIIGGVVAILLAEWMSPASTEITSTAATSSSGNADLVEMPDLVGEDNVVAQATLDRLGIDASLTEAESESDPVGSVASQYPAPGTMTRTAALIVSTGAGDAGTSPGEEGTESTTSSTTTSTTTTLAAQEPTRTGTGLQIRQGSYVDFDSGEPDWGIAEGLSGRSEMFWRVYSKDYDIPEIARLVNGPPNRESCDDPAAEFWRGTLPIDAVERSMLEEMSFCFITDEGGRAWVTFRQFDADDRGSAVIDVAYWPN